MDQPAVTQLLRDWREGKEHALDRLLPLLHDTLRNLAARYMRGEKAGHTLQPTALVNEAYLRLIGADVTWQGRSHFLAVAAQTMRRILVDHAKGKARKKRGGGNIAVTLDEARLSPEKGAREVIDLNEALVRFAKFDERKARILELKFFGGMTYDEIAEAMSISPATVDRELRVAKAWLYRELHIS